MASSMQRAVYTHEILERTALWQFRDGIQGQSDLERYCVTNSAIEFRRDGAELSFCVLVSSGCSHSAAVEASPSENTIKVTVYRLNRGFEQKWTVTHTTDEDAGASHRVGWFDTAKMHGGVTEDGESVLIVYRPAGRPTKVYIASADGLTQRRPPSDTNSMYSLSSGRLSEDSEYIFYSRSGSKFGKDREAKVVEAYSIRNLARMKAVTFAFGDGRNLRNTQLIRPLQLQGPIYMSIETSGFRGDDNERNSPPLIASSDRKLHWNFSGIDQITSCGGSNVFISTDGAHLFYVQQNEAMLHHWDLKKPSLEPLGSVRLPGVEYSQSRRWLIYGKETSIRDAIPEQKHQIRYSPKCKVVTVVSANNSTVVVNVLLTFNLQLIYHQKVQHTTWAGYVPLQIGFNDSTGLNVFAMSPTLSYNAPGRPSQIVGAMGALLPLGDIFEKIKKIEDYFDTTNERVVTLMNSVDNGEGRPICRFSWRPGVLDRDGPAAIVHELGQSPLTTAEDARRQQEFYENIFANPKSSVSMHSTQELRHFFVPHIFTFTYPWNPGQSVSVFGVVMKNEYHIIAIGPSPSTSAKGSEVVRTLYATDIKVRADAKERIEIYKSDSNYILYVSQDGRGTGGYSGAPMPIPRYTVISPHFLEEDAWYDTFIIHRAANVTMPTGWIQTPNPALTSTTSFYAYFEPRTFIVQDVIDYGHRARSAYVLPKYLLWQEYGLRGLRSPNPNDVFFGGGRYADALGPYFRSIYDDRTYDNANPLFPSTFALACNADHRSQGTKHVDAFFRRLHQEKHRLLTNSQAVSCTLPLACRARPIASLSFMRHIVLFQHKINDIGTVEVKNGATKTDDAQYSSQWHQNLRFLSDLWYTFKHFWSSPDDVHPEPNTSRVTLPLPGFCSFHYKLYRAPPVSTRDDPLWEFVRAATPLASGDFLRWETQLLKWVAYTGRGPSSPFTRLVEEILGMKDREIQLSFLKVAWLEKLLVWKMQTFGLRIYLTRTALPILLLFIVHLVVGILLTENDDMSSGTITAPIIVLACIEVLVSCYILFIKIRQIYRIPRLFLRSIFNYIDVIALSLGITLFIFVVSQNAPPRAFLAFSTLLIWIATILVLRIYRPVGMLLLLLTETLQGVFSFLVLLFFIIIGFTFVPFLLLRNFTTDPLAENPFSSFLSTISQMLNFISSDYGALQPFESASAAVRTLRALYIIVITILFLNTLIAILNLKMKRADKNAGNLYHLQMASLQVEIELGLLSSSERARRDWFPEWFSYSMTETEKRVWTDYVEKYPLKWADENDFNEDKDHAPLNALETASQQNTSALSSSTAAASSSSTSKPHAQESTSVAQSSSKAANSQSQQSEPASQPEATPLIIHDGKPTTDLIATLEPFDDSKFPLDEDLGTSWDSDQFLDDFDENLWGGFDAKRGTSHSLTQSSPNTCVVCLNPGRLCTNCRKVAYCGREHQRQHWKAHKSECTPPEQGQGQVTAAVAEQMVELAELSCTVCGKPGRLCTSCRMVAYCGKEHQKQDWKRHKSDCKGKGKA